jgi:filamentous hemagglutinin family protein
MNHIYRSIWNEKTGTFVAVSENTKTGGKKASTVASVVAGAGFALKALAVSLMLAFGSHSYALPANGTVVAGSATITGSTSNMTINQSSQNAVLNWQSFNIGTGEAVRFVQPNSNSVALNRVLGADATSILGTLSANGKVFIVNPNGILFGKGASVNVGGLVASTRNIADSDFMAGNYKFAGTGNGSILNQGTINADGGYVALLGANVSNEGVIAARLGTVALAAGNAVTLDVAGDGLLNVSVDQGAVNALVQNGGMIQADGGHVLLTAQAAGDLLHTVVNNTGVIQAQTIENHDGVIKLLGDMQSGTVNVGGKLDASAPTTGNGGFIETSAAHVKIADDTRVTTAAAQGLTGSWLIDPTDYTIAASGGDITGAALSTNLGSTGITILSTSGGSGTSGNVNVNDTVTWSANKLTLNAQNNININTAMNASGTASLALQYGQGAVAAGNTSAVNVNAPINLPAGNNFSTKQGSDGSVKAYTVITSLGAQGSTTTTDLQGMNGNLAGNYVLGTNIDAATTSGWNSGAGFAPVVGSQLVTMGGFTFTQLLPFTGIFDGLGHTISGLTINQPTVSNVGMFGLTNSTGLIRNVGLVGGSVTGAWTTGALVAENHGSINNSFATGSVTANSANSLYIGGLVGSNFGSISDSYATGTVSGQRSVGGLVGTNGTQGGSSIGSITRSYSTGAVTAGTYNSGGLAGNNEAGSSIIDSYATGAVSGGKNNAGGLVGQNYGSISTSYATGAVTDIEGYVGGLVGSNGYSTGSITLSYSSGAVSGGNHLGGLAGANFGQASAISNSYWNKDTSGQATSGGGTGLTSVQMQTGSNFAGFNFTTAPGGAGNNWVMVDVDGTLNNAGGALGATRPMLASEYSTRINNAHQLQLMAMDMAANYTLAQNINAAATGTANNAWSGSTFIPIGISTFNTFTGVFDGLGHTINGLTINRSGTDYTGLFRLLRGTVRNIGLVGGSTVGGQFTGALVGRNYGTISNSYATGTVSGTGNVGGLVGLSNSGTISDSHATGAVTGTSNSVGGLAGGSYGTMSNSYATGKVSGHNFVGGLVGAANGNGINTSYATGAVSGSTYVGGLVGYNAATTSNSYASGTVSGTDAVGGLVGYNNGTISKTYATGAVTGSTRVGGLVGLNLGTSNNSFWDTATTGQASSAGGGKGMSTNDMQLQANFTSATAANGNANPAWDMANTWLMVDGQTSPLLRSLMTALTITANNATKTYDGTTYSGANGVTYSITPNQDLLLGSLSYMGNAQGAVNAGSYTIAASGLYSTSQQGYLITYVDGALTVNKAVLTATLHAADKTYDGTTAAPASLTIDSGLVGGETVNATGSATFNTKDVASANLVTVNSISLANGTGLASNYSLAAGQTAAASITPAGLVISGITAANKAYDGTTAASIDTSAARYAGLVHGDAVAVSATGVFDNKNAGTGKTVALTSHYLGADTGNYVITDQATTTADITATTADNPPPIIDSTKTQQAVMNAIADASVMQTSPALGPEDRGAAPAHAWGGTSAAILPVGLSGPGNLSGLNVTLVGAGIKLPSDMNGTDTVDGNK